MEVASNLKPEWELYSMLSGYQKILIGIKHNVFWCSNSEFGNLGFTVASAREGYCVECNKVIPKHIKLQWWMLLDGSSI